MATATQQKAYEWLKAQNHSGTYSRLIAEHIEKRCGEDEGLAEDVTKAGKSWDGCMKYIRNKAQKQATHGCAVIEDHVVYEWSEDYFRSELTDKELDKKAPAAKVERPKGIDKPKKAETAEKKPEKKPEKKVTPAAKPEVKSKDDFPGQMDIFSLLGGAT